MENGQITNTCKNAIIKLQTPTDAGTVILWIILKRHGGIPHKGGLRITPNPDPKMMHVERQETNKNMNFLQYYSGSRLTLLTIYISVCLQVNLDMMLQK